MSKEWLEIANRKLESMPEAGKETRERAMADLYFFACLVNPGYMYGDIHKNIFKWLEEYSLYGMNEKLTSNKLIMLPRAHLKRHIS